MLLGDVGRPEKRDSKADSMKKNWTDVKQKTKKRSRVLKRCTSTNYCAYTERF
jgi:hypothetical protein